MPLLDFASVYRAFLIGPGFANAHGNPQIFAVPWKSTLSKSTLIGLVPGFANMHVHKSFLIGPVLPCCHTLNPKCPAHTPKCPKVPNPATQHHESTAQKLSFTYATVAQSTAFQLSFNKPASVSLATLAAAALPISLTFFN